jgi:hypothetical protein
MGSLANLTKQADILQKINSVFSQSLNKESEGDIIHWGQAHLSEINNVILRYSAPLKDSNFTGVMKDDLADYIYFLETKNINLSTRLAELEMKFRTIEPFIPTLIKITSNYMAAETRIEGKKKYLIKKYSLKKDKELEPWTGAREKVDISNVPLDEILDNIEE